MYSHRGSLAFYECAYVLSELIPKEQGVQLALQFKPEVKFHIE